MSDAVPPIRKINQNWYKRMEKCSFIEWNWKSGEIQMVGAVCSSFVLIVESVYTIKRMCTYFAKHFDIYLNSKHNLEM